MLSHGFGLVGGRIRSAFGNSRRLNHREGESTETFGRGRSSGESDAEISVV